MLLRDERRLVAGLVVRAHTQKLTRTMVQIALPAPLYPHTHENIRLDLFAKGMKWVAGTVSGFANQRGTQNAP
jgi:hypothetical protein